jgi:dihydrofolate synthase/folylpolyglutamate synthase
MKYDLTNIKALLRHLGNPHNNFQSIHIAGTNGKGSTASFIASILMEHSLRVGLFTSPHILRFNERIRINGNCITDSFIKKFLNENNKIIRKISPSFFEVNTAMAFEYFSRKKVDIAVVECGLGGRLDSTNVLYPALSIITQIGMDHMQYLGNTLKKIAQEKVGIVKPGIEVIVSDNNKSLKKLFQQKIEKDFLFYMDDEIKILKLAERKFAALISNSEGFNFTIPLTGDFQARNAGAAIVASSKFLDENGICPSNKCIQKGLAKIKVNTGYHGRLESIKIKNSEFIFDVSHNSGGLEQTYKALKRKPPEVVIFGIMEDKDISAAINEILKLSNKIIFTKAKYKRAADPKKLYKIAAKKAPKSYNLVIKDKIDEAIKEALSSRAKRILITGSFYLVSEAIKALGYQKIFTL